MTPPDFRMIAEGITGQESPDDLEAALKRLIERKLIDAWNAALEEASEIIRPDDWGEFPKAYKIAERIAAKKLPTGES